jgi:ubiquinone/menaquinone biosynthesis C-methylase UbiE
MGMKTDSSKQVEKVRDIFNGMSDEYDNLKDLWYRHSFGFIDQTLVREFCLNSHKVPKPLSLDIGCGTGIQSVRLASLGYKVIGMDIAENLLQIARIKLRNAGFGDAYFIRGNAESLPFPNASAEAINCCGPVLSFVPDWKRALREMARCLKPGGKLLLEIEGRWNFDLVWEIVNAIGFNFLGYDQSLKASLGHLFHPWHKGYSTQYSFRLESGESVSMPLKLFTSKEIRKAMKSRGLFVDKSWGLHGITNIIPSTILHKPDPGRFAKAFFPILSSLEMRMNHLRPLRSFGCSLLVCAHKGMV